MLGEFGHTSFVTHKCHGILLFQIYVTDSLYETAAHKLIFLICKLIQAQSWLK